MTIQKIVAVIAAVTSLTLFGNLVMFQSPVAEISAQTSTSSTTVKAENDNKSEQSSEKEAGEEKSSTSEETKATEKTQASSESTVASESSTAASEITEPSEELAITETPIVEAPTPAPSSVEAAAVEQSDAMEETSEPVSQLQPNMLQIAGSYISYSNAGQGSGQAVIDADHSTAATWGGSPVQSGNDGMNTHIIGHNPGAFNALFSLGVGSTIEVSDASGQISTYTVQNIVTVDDSAYGVDGTDYWDQITGTGGGERLTLQTCINDYQNLIVFAA
ncbi:class F sortase [Candidatus Enterococcus ferrettii]|uniref:Sortase n=1 Tax=Candidatus Enterococcus ferrettii TaxID=2815324 RepID=A0ABV0ETM5_9ENTE|nr:class F sortase [Enterococcus sp. 665A]MBO1342236.1 sortase [Enterococcus sp. 665A]